MLGAVRNLSAAGQPAYDNQVTIDGTGDAVITWLRSDSTYEIAQARRLSAAGVLGPILNLTAPGEDAIDTQVAVDFNGNAVFTWRRWDGANDRIYARTLSATGTVGRAMTLSAAGQDAIQPRLAMNDTGEVEFVWTRSDGANRRIQTRSLSPTGVLSGIRTLSDAGEDAYSPQAAVDPAGDATFAWYRYDGSEYVIQTRALSATGGLSPFQTLSDTGEFAYEPVVGVGDAGDAVFAWYRKDGTNWRVQTRTLSAASVLVAAQTLSAAGQDGLFPQLAVNPAGDSVITWSRSDGVNTRAEVTTMSGAGTVSAVTTLSDPGQNAYTAPAGIDGGGTIVDWQRSDGVNNRISTQQAPEPRPETRHKANHAGRGASNASPGLPHRALSPFRPACRTSPLAQLRAALAIAYLLPPPRLARALGDNAEAADPVVLAPDELAPGHQRRSARVVLSGASESRGERRSRCRLDD